MAEETSLQELILGYFRQVGGLVEPPAYGIHEVLLPDEVAARWGIDPLQKFTFTPDTDPEAFVTYTTPLVEALIEEIRGQTANGHFFVNNIRLEKAGLYAAIEKALKLPNAKLFPVHGAGERQRMYHVVRFNFKASLVADEKRELILPVWMNVQGGYAVPGEEIEGLAILDSDNQTPHLSPAEPTWVTGAALSPAVLSALLERARQGARTALAPNLSGLQKRLQRFLMLDQARLNEYYDDLVKDTQKRLRNAEEDRRPALEAKLAATQAERQSKLVDVEHKYRLHVELELVNLAVIAQPKLDLLVEIRKRTHAVQRRVVWDPLRHIVEPLCCDVCGQAREGEALHLCDEGHLAHTDCLAPQCVECKRTYCQQCADKIQTCVVCDRPVCVHSLVKCPECRRITCHEHANACHAADGAPLRPQAKPVEEPPAKPAGKEEPAAGRKPGRKKETPPAKSRAAKAKPVVPSFPTNAYIEVYTDPEAGEITAFVMVKKREIAARRWAMSDEGISCECLCEKGWACKYSQVVYRPWPESQLEAQMMDLLSILRNEYRVGPTKLHYFQVRQGGAVEERKLKVPYQWRDAETLERARKGYEELTAINSRRRY